MPEASGGQTAFPFTTNTLNNFKIKKTKRWFLVFEQCLCSVPDRSKHCTQLSNPSNTAAKYKSKSHVKGKMYQFIEGANYRSLVIDIKLCSNKTTIAHSGQIAKEEVILRMLLPWRRSAPATSVNVLCLSPIRWNINMVCHHLPNTPVGNLRAWKTTCSTLSADWLLARCRHAAPPQLTARLFKVY